MAAPKKSSSKAKPAAARRRLSAEERREEILRAGMSVFAERGYDGASMAEIASAAGITPAVIYDHFESKAALQITLLERETEALFMAVGKALFESPDDPAERMRRGMDAYFTFVENDPYAWRILLREPPAGSEISATYNDIVARSVQGISAFIRLGTPPELLDTPNADRDIEMFAAMMRSSQAGLAQWWYEHQEVPRSEVVDRILEFCWMGLERLAQGERVRREP